MVKLLRHITYKFGFILLLLVFAGSLSQCKRTPPYQADISAVSMEPVSVNRYEQVLFSINPAALREEVDPYVETFHLFLGDEIDQPWAQRQLYDYITDPLIIELFQETMEVWTSLTELEATLTKAFSYYRYHFPELPIPDLYSYVSGLDYTMPVKYADNSLVFALDMYLGREFPKYLQIGIPAYQVNRLEPPFLPVDMMHMMAEKHMQETGYLPESFLDYMIYEGKMLYFVDCMLPLSHDSLKIGYTADQLNWMEQNRGYVWSYYLENEFLYSSDRQIISRFIGEAPFTSAFSRNSAPRTAAWIGWQIVREYMRRNPDKTLKELITSTDSRQILNESRYRGR